MTIPPPIPKDVLRGTMSFSSAPRQIAMAERLHYVEARLASIQALVDEQAEKDGLWCDAKTATEGYLQGALRRLHEAVEGKTGDECAVDALKGIDRERT